MLVGYGGAEGVSDLYFKIVNLYTFIEFVFIKEGNKFIFEIELFYIFSYFQIFYFATNFYSEV